MPKPTPANIPSARQKNTPTPATPKPAPTPAAAAETEPLTTAKWTEGLNQRDKTAKLREIREWCRTHGHPGVPTHGKIPNDALAAYDAAHPANTSYTLTDFGKAMAKAGAAIADSAAEINPLDAIPNDLEPNDTADAELEVADLPDIAHRSDLLDETRTRIAAGGVTSGPTPAIVGDNPDRDETRVVPLHGRCKQCTLDNHPGCTGHLYAGRDNPRCGCDCPASRFLRGAAPTTTPERPEWADVTIPEDIERARRIAVQLEQELAHTTEQLTTAHNALELALQRWNTEKTRADRLQLDLTVTTGVVRLYAALLDQDDLELAHVRRISEQRLDAIVELVRKVDNLNQQHRRRPWWTR